MSSQKEHPEPLIIPRSEHGISRNDIDTDALKVLYRLHRNGFLAYLVGGGVRDLLLGKQPKDFDIGTNAHPRQLKKLFRNCWIIGRRFRIAHIRFGTDKVIEVSTFRRDGGDFSEEDEEGLIQSDNTYGTPAEDAWRRDLTINGLFYNIADFTIIDYVGGMKDLERGIIRAIGDPDQRFTEDPVRMIRAIRHAARTGFRIQRDTSAAITRHAPEIVKCARARVAEEFLREFRGGYSASSLKLMLDRGLLDYLVPDLAALFRSGRRSETPPLSWRRLEVLDEEVRSGPLSDPVLVACVFIPYLEKHYLPIVTPQVRKRDMNRVLAEAREPLKEGLINLGLPRKKAEQAVQLMIALAHCRREKAYGRAPEFLRGRSYRDEALTLFRIDGLARGESGDILLPEAPPEKEAARPPRKRRKRKKKNPAKQPGGGNGREAEAREGAAGQGEGPEPTDGGASAARQAEGPKTLGVKPAAHSS